MTQRQDFEITITKLYQKHLHREPDKTGLYYFVSQLENKKLSLNDISKILTESEEGKVFSEYSHYSDKYWNDLGTVVKYKNKLSSGDENLHWIEDIKNRFKQFIPFEDVLIVGCGNGWLVYMPSKITKKIIKDNEKILDIHDFSNAVKVIKEIQPDIVFAHAGVSGHIHFALRMASLSKKIPVISGFWSFTTKREKNVNSITAYFSKFFSSTVNTGSDKSSIKFGTARFYFFKMRFLYRTLKSLELSKLTIFSLLLLTIKENLSFSGNSNDTRFPSTIHWVEGGKLFDQLIKKGFDKSSIFLTGNPMYDSAFKKISQFEQHIQTNKKRVLLITNPLVEHGIWTKKQRNSVIKEILNELAVNDEKFDLTIKIHPYQESLEEYQELVKETKNETHIHQEGGILDFIQDTDVVISYTSSGTSPIYSLIAKKPIVIFNLNETINDRLLDRDLAIKCNNTKELTKSIESAIENNPSKGKNADNFIEEFFYKSDGKASERISELILKIIKKT